MDVLNFFFPKGCIGCKRIGLYLCDSCFARVDLSPELICAVCSKPAISGLTHPLCQRKYEIDGVFAAVVYKGVVKKLLYQFKFSPFLSDLTPLLGNIIYEGFIQHEPFVKIDKKNALLVPIPLSTQKIKQRGYNQAELLAKYLSKKFLIPTQNLLIRIKNTNPQSKLSRNEREINIHGAFVLKSPIPIDTVFLVDDIVTSGVTLNEAAKVLKKSGVKRVYGVTLAHGK